MVEEVPRDQHQGGEEPLVEDTAAVVDSHVGAPQEVNRTNKVPTKWTNQTGARNMRTAHQTLFVHTIGSMARVHIFANAHIAVPGYSSPSQHQTNETLTYPAE